MAHSCMRKYKRISKSAPILVQCNVFLEDTHSHTRRVVEMKTLDQLNRGHRMDIGILLDLS